MPKPIIERAARALAAYEYGDGFDEPWEPFVGMAKEVLRAIRESSEGMKREGGEVHGNYPLPTSRGNN